MDSHPHPGPLPGWIPTLTPALSQREREMLLVAAGIQSTALQREREKPLVAADIQSTPLSLWERGRG